MKTINFLLSILIVNLFIVGCGGSSSDTMTVGGYVLLEDDTPVQGVTVTFLWPDDGSGPVEKITDADGWYSYKYGEIFEDYRLTITPSHPDYDFDPTEYDLPKVHGDVFDLDFVAIPR